jgi:uncharacterized protein (TIGR00296 family)
MFVTWKTEKDHVLRGCIGTTQPVNLVKGLTDYSLKSALDDYRFPPVKFDELPKLVCTVALLADFEACGNYRDWIIGTHGVAMRFQDSETDRSFHALFLPEVMTEHSKKV